MDIATVRRRAARLAIASAAVLAPALPSWAASASASLTNISLSVVDLDPNDGVMAGFSLVPGISSFLGSLQAENSVLTDFQDISRTGLNSPFISASGSASVSGARTSGASTPTSLVVSGSTSAAGTRFFSELQFTTGDEGLLFNPNTRLIVRADYSVSASVFDACGAFECEEAFARAGILSFGNLTEFEQSREATAHAVAQPGGGGTGPQSGSFVMQLDVGPLSGAATRLQFVAAVTGVGVVPEPENYALMLIGLGVLGMVVSRRRHR
jgi:hypothetical protein